jgi:PKD repeat protein
MTRPVTAFAVILLAGTAAACLDESITGTRPLSFSFDPITGSPAVGDSVGFSYDATGTGIFGVILDFGDGAVDTVENQSSSVVSMQGTINHAYTDAGTYEVTGRVEAPGGVRADTLEVVITGG